jgi:hypothetical protein
MNKVYLIGDCHSARVLEHWDPNNCPVDFKAWGKAGQKAWDINFYEKYKDNEMSSGTETEPYYVNYDLKMGFNEIKDGGLILLWIGYVDCRQLIPRYKNTEECVSHYVKHSLEYFKDFKVRFIEPLPQFTEMLLKYEGISPSYTYEERLKYNKEFCELLTKYSNEYGLDKVITQDQIFKAVGLSEFTPEITPKDRPHPVDGLKPEYMKKIYDLFINESVKSF